MRIRVGLIGLGDAWQQRHAPALRALGDRFEVRAVCEQVAHRAQQAAKEFSAETVDGYRALAGREDVDAVLILSPQWYGPLPILAACESGKAIYCTADLDFKAHQAPMLKRRIEQAGVAFMAELPHRLAPATLRLKELIATQLGAPRLLFCHRRSPVPASTPTSKPTNRTTVRELVELVDWCRYVVGCEPAWVNGLMHPREGESGEDDYQMMSLGFPATVRPEINPVAQISCGRYLPAQWQEAIGYRLLANLQVCCERGVAFVDLPATLVWFDDAGRHQESLESERPVAEQLLARFHHAVTSLVRRTDDLEDAYGAWTIVRQARKSHREGRRLNL